MKMGLARGRGTENILTCVVEFPILGRTYHVIFNPPKVTGKDDPTGEALVQRPDDEEVTVRKRLDIYHSQTQPLVNYYTGWANSGEAHAPKFVKIPGVGSVENIRDTMFGKLAGLAN